MVNDIGSGNFDIFGTLFKVALLSLLTGAAGNLKTIWTYIVKWIRRTNYPTLEFKCTYEPKKGFDAGDQFRSWLWHISQKIDKKQAKNIHCLQAIHNSETNYTYYEEDDATLESGKDPNMNQWIPVQHDRFVIEDNIEGDVYTEEKARGTSGGDKKEKGSGGTVTEYTLVITLKKGTIYDLKHRHVHIMHNYLKARDEELENKPYIYVLKGFNERYDDATPEWKRIEFSSTRNMDNTFVENRDLFLHNVDRFLFRKDLYDRVGDPHTFSVLLYGKPGCGKSSLIKATVDYCWKKGVKKHLFVVPVSMFKKSSHFRAVLFDTEHEVSPENRIFAFEDFDAATTSNVFLKRSDKNRTWKLALRAQNWNMEDMGKNVGGSNTTTNGEFNENAEANDDSDGDSSQEEDENKEGGEDPSESSRGGGGGNKDNIMRRRRLPFSGTKNEREEWLKMMGKRMFETDDMSLSEILNAMDGLCERTGQIMFWTTNVEDLDETFDPAFLRNGRMHMKINVGLASREAVCFFAGQYFDLSSVDAETLCSDDKEGNKPVFDIMSSAKVKQLCSESTSFEEFRQTYIKTSREMAMAMAMKNKEQQQQQQQQQQ